MRYDITGMVHFLKSNWNRQKLTVSLLRYIIHYHQRNWTELLLVITIIFHSCFCSFNKHLLNINVVSVIDAEDKAANNRHMVSTLMGISPYQLSPSTSLLLSLVLVYSSWSSSPSPRTLGTDFLLTGEVKDGGRSGGCYVCRVLSPFPSYVHSYCYNVSSKCHFLTKKFSDYPI